MTETGRDRIRAKMEAGEYVVPQDLLTGIRPEEPLQDER